MNLTKRLICPLAFALISIALVSLAGAQVSITRVADINPGSGGSGPDELTYFNGQVFFRASTPSTGSELWRYGPDGAQLVADIVPGTGSSTPGAFVIYQNQLYFGASTSGTFDNYTLWHYDGTSTSQAHSLNFGAAPNYASEFGVYNNNIYFRARNPATGIELYRYDGAGASLAVNINPDPIDSFFVSNGSSWPTSFTVYNGNLYFQAIGSNGGEWEMWQYDGTTARRLSSITGGPTISTSGRMSTVFDGKLYFNGSDTTHGTELWQFDGTSTKLVADINPGKANSAPGDFSVLGHTLYFTADDGVHGAELWKYDGTTASLAADINVGPVGSIPLGITAYGNAIYFAATDKTVPGRQGGQVSDPSGVGRELWSFDGNTASLVADINPGSSSSLPSSLLVTPDGLYFSANDGTTGIELYRLVNVPEPASVVLLSLACAVGFLWRGRR